MVFLLMSSLHRKFQFKLRKSSLFGLYRNASLVFLHDPVTDAQAETHAFPDVLRREERIENLVEMFGRDARAVVADGQNGAAVLDPAIDPNRRFLAVVERFLAQRVEGILEQV